MGLWKLKTNYLCRRDARMLCWQNGHLNLGLGTDHVLFLLVLIMSVCASAPLAHSQSSSVSDGQPLRQGSGIENPPPYNGRIDGGGQATFDGKRAYEHLIEVCNFGRRFSNSQGMFDQQRWLQTFFRELNAEVIMQPFVARDPRSGNNVEMANLIVRWHPNRKRRLLFCCHYDTRPFPDSDKRNPQGVFIGANDGASGVAVLCELGQHVSNAAIAQASAGDGTDDALYGVDFVFFDGEELVYDRRTDPLFLGSTFFANQYVSQRGAVVPTPQSGVGANPVKIADNTAESPYKYVYAILIDMVGDKDLQIFYEGNSLEYAPRLTRSIWGVAQKMKIKSFVPRKKHILRDDHLPLNQIAKIPTCDIIDFDYPSPRHKHAFWHTEADVPKNCSAESLQTVGSVLLQWLSEMQALAKGLK